ncbi:MAG: ABC transporter ATP-binding protein [Corynebacterium sp.]|nr:ABC transporter ATP-binding protein [Corynebacterium sp.]
MQLDESSNLSLAAGTVDNASTLIAREKSEHTKVDKASQLKEDYKVGKAAIKRLQEPVRMKLRIGQLLVIISGVLSIAPYVALLKLGKLFLEGHRTGVIDQQKAWEIAFILVSIFCFSLFIYFLALLITHFADLSLKNVIRRRIVDKLAKVPLAWFSQTTSGSLRKTLQDDVSAVHIVIAHGPVDLLNAIVTPFSLAAFAFYIDWRLGLLSMATIPLYLGTYSLSMRGMTEKTAELNQKLEKVSATMVEFVAGISVVKAFGRVGQAHGRYLKATEEFGTFYYNWCMPLVSIACFSMSLVSVPVILLVNLGGGALLINAGYVDIVEVITTSLIALVLPGTFMTIASAMWAYQLAGPAAVRLVELLDFDELEIVESETAPLSNKVIARNVSYGYQKASLAPQDNVYEKAPGSLAVEDINLELEPGTVTALIGPSGSGKTTLAKLIARFDDPTHGEIFLGNQDLRTLDSKTLYSHIGFVLQDPQLLNTSIKNNIALGMPNASNAEIKNAASVAQIDDFIDSLPNGYDTVLGSDTKLSGGQQQRIAIARAVLKDTPVLILDEATALADPESESEIQKAMSSLVKGRTVLVIAHRAAAIRGADQIVVLDKGRITGIGTHEQLLDNHHYKNLMVQSDSKGGK